MKKSDDNPVKPVATAGPVKLGDLTVNRLGFGTMRVCGPQVWGEPKDRAGALAVLRRAYALGHNFFDTADSYGPHVSETLIAEALHPYPADLVIATKGGLVRPRASSWDECGTPEHLKLALDGSLKRLKLERIDLYQFHAPDPRVPFARSMETLAALQRAGKIRHLGVSNVSVKQLEEARRIAPIVSVQNQYSIESRGDEDVLLACEGAGIAFIPWYPLGAGNALEIVQGEAHRRPPRGHTGPGCARLAARALAGRAADPGHRLGQASRRECGRGGRAAAGGRSRRAVVAAAIAA